MAARDRALDVVWAAGPLPGTDGALGAVYIGGAARARVQALGGPRGRSAGRRGTGQAAGHRERGPQIKAARVAKKGCAMRQRRPDANKQHHLLSR